MKKINKNKYPIQLFAFAFAFALIVSPASASEINPENVVKYVNEARKSKGLADLSVNEKLMAAAKDKLNDMIAKNYFAHTSPSGTNPWFWFGKNGYDYRYAGENLAINFTKAEDQQKAWMESPKHRKNILNPDYNEIGVAVGAGEIDGEVSLITVQEFGTLAGAAQTGKSFNSPQNKNLIKDSGKIAPQVLSAKNVNLINNEKNNLQKTSDFEANGLLLEMAYVFAAVFLLVPLALSPVAFLAVAAEKILIICQKKKTTENPVHATC